MPLPQTIYTPFLSRFRALQKGTRASSSCVSLREYPGPSSLHLEQKQDIGGVQEPSSDSGVQEAGGWSEGSQPPGPMWKLAESGPDGGMERF